MAIHTKRGYNGYQHTMNNFVVYSWNENGVPFYIGMGTRKRSTTKNSRNPYCLNKRRKAERENTFSIEILESNLSKNQAALLEKHYIQQIGRSSLTNMTDGGEGNNYWKGKQRDPETRRKISDSLTGSKWSKERRNNFDPSVFQGKNNHNYGKKPSKETRIKQSLAKKNKPNHQSKPVHSPFGVFDTVRELETVSGIPYSTLCNRIRSNNYPEYYKES